MKKLSIHTFMHVPFEGLGCIETWIHKNNHSLSYTHFYDNYKFPSLDDIDWLVVMGGPMGVYEEVINPWLMEEKSFIRKAIDNGKTVIGICLGSQLIAEVLGSKVYPNKQKEIGWFDIKLTDSAKELLIFKDFEEQFPVFHWHGDTFDLPSGSKHLISSDICKNQAFIYQEKVLGLQFHFEVTFQTLNSMVDNGSIELMDTNNIQSAKQILKRSDLIEGNNKKMYRILDYFAE